MEDNSDKTMQSKAKQEHNEITAIEPIDGEKGEEENQLAKSDDIPEEKVGNPKDESKSELSMSDPQNHDLNHNSEDSKLNDKVRVDDQTTSSRTEATQDYSAEGLKSITPQTSMW
jgi:hypothetical protein